MNKFKKINSIEELKKCLGENNEYKEFFILLNYGLRSSKTISYDKEKNIFWIFNEIDGTECSLTEEELKDEDITNIGKAINLGAFYQY
ncbi:MAG: hypothetical protein MJ198_10680 [Bacteroidales bacterium]|nr:hypothetical protein [Bacteroidales bacterium]